MKAFSLNLSGRQGYFLSKTQVITSSGQYATATGVDTVRISGNVTNQTVTTFRLINPAGGGGAGGPVTVETDSIQPAGAMPEITAPSVIQGNPPAIVHPVTYTNQDR
jgi:hypothetical protein